MGLPYIQLESDFLRSKASRIASVLRVHRHVVIGMATDLFDHAIPETSTKSRPPDGNIVDPDAADIIENWMGWAGEQGKAIDAFMRAGVLEKLEIGIRVKGMERYRTAWEKNTRRKPGGNRAVTGRKPGETGPERKRKRKMEMEDLPSEDLGAAPPAAVPLKYEPPKTPEAEWSGKDFFVWAQSRRIASGLLGEKWPREEKLRSWWHTLTLQKVSVKRLKEAFYRYGQDPYWERPEVNPPHPWAAFQSGWEKYTPQEAA